MSIDRFSTSPFRKSVCVAAWKNFGDEASSPRHEHGWPTRSRETLAASFDYAIVPMGWKQLHPQEHQFNTEPVDDWIESLNKKRLPAIAGPLIRLGPDHVPDWMVIWEHDFDMLRDLAYEYVQKIMPGVQTIITDGRSILNLGDLAKSGQGAGRR